MIINILIFDSYIHVIFKKLAKGEKRKKGKGKWYSRHRNNTEEWYAEDIRIMLLDTKFIINRDGNTYERNFVVSEQQWLGCCR